MESTEPYLLIKRTQRENSRLHLLGGDNDLPCAVGGEAVCRREAPARRRRGRRLGGLLRSVLGCAEIHYENSRVGEQ